MRFEGRIRKADKDFFDAVLQYLQVVSPLEDVGDPSVRRDPGHLSQRIRKPAETLTTDPHPSEGIASADIESRAYEDEIRSIPFGDGGENFLIDGNEIVVALPGKKGDVQGISMPFSLS